jgi:class 3 adenylate cyclase
MSDRPRWLGTRDGTVTLLFTDIVGSTDRLEQWGEARWLDALRAHNALVRELVHTNRGAEVKFLGDGWMVAFIAPADAVRCAIALQRVIPTQPDAFEVRIGIHTGDAAKEGADFLGRDVILASRLSRAAGAGEILTSTVVRLACGADGFTFTDGRRIPLKGLGTHLVFGVEPLADGRAPSARAAE